MRGRDGRGGSCKSPHTPERRHKNASPNTVSVAPHFAGAKCNVISPIQEAAPVRVRLSVLVMLRCTSRQRSEERRKPYLDLHFLASLRGPGAPLNLHPTLKYCRLRQYFRNEQAKCGTHNALCSFSKSPPALPRVPPLTPATRAFRRGCPSGCRRCRRRRSPQTTFSRASRGRSSSPR